MLAAEQFLNIVNGILIATIAVVVLCAINLLFIDVFSFIRDRTAEGIAAVLGSLLIIWVWWSYWKLKLLFSRVKSLT